MDREEKFIVVGTFSLLVSCLLIMFTPSSNLFIASSMIIGGLMLCEPPLIQLFILKGMFK